MEAKYNIITKIDQSTVSVITLSQIDVDVLIRDGCLLRGSKSGEPKPKIDLSNRPKHYKKKLHKSDKRIAGRHLNQTVGLSRGAITDIIFSHDTASTMVDRYGCRPAFVNRLRRRIKGTKKEKTIQINAITEKPPRQHHDQPELRL